MMRFSIFQDSDIGARSVNQDRMGYCFTRESLLMVVADGMGGHLRGEVAAQLTLQACAGLFQRLATPRLAQPQAFLREALLGAHRELVRYQSVHQLPEAPRTTVIACVVQDTRAWWAHAGDSRLYCMRDARVVHRTLDHSRVQELLSQGLIDAQAQATHPERNKVFNCLGAPREPVIELADPVVLRPGDRLLLCTDGVWSGLSQSELTECLSNQALQRAVPMMVRQAVAQSGLHADNATAIGLQWDGPGPDDDIPTLSGMDLPDGAITTTIAFGRPDDPGPAVLTDEDIERQIADIQQAIRRSRSPHDREIP